MFRRYVVCISLVSLLMTGAQWGSAAAEQDWTVLVIPARHTIVQIGFDMTRIRPVHLVACRDGAAGAPIIHVWDGDAGDWVQIGLDEYASGGVFTTRPRRIVLIGSERDLPQAVRRASSWAAELERIPSLQIVDLVNGLDGLLHFAPWEWKWLAKRHELKLKDLNEDRRRYGRYGPPGRNRTQVPRSDDRSGRQVAPMPVPDVRPVPPAPLSPRAPVAERESAVTGVDIPLAEPEQEMAPSLEAEPAPEDK
ncbi:hypothetical protein ACFLSJ_00315 [Verrucomicrobiota bacterium]